VYVEQLQFVELLDNLFQLIEYQMCRNTGYSFCFHMYYEDDAGWFYENNAIVVESFYYLALVVILGSPLYDWM